MSEQLNKNQNLLYQLETLASYAPSDLDYPEMEVGYEHENGADWFQTVCLIEVGKKALARIVELESLTGISPPKED